MYLIIDHKYLITIHTYVNMLKINVISKHWLIIKFNYFNIITK